MWDSSPGLWGEPQWCLEWGTRWMDPYWSHLNDMYCRANSASTPPQQAAVPGHQHAARLPTSNSSKWPREVGWDSSHTEQNIPSLISWRPPKGQQGSFLSKLSMPEEMSEGCWEISDMEKSNSVFIPLCSTILSKSSHLEFSADLTTKFIN